MNFLSMLSIIAFCIYLFIGIYAFSKERNNKINQLFMVFCSGMAIWSFAYAFVYVTVDKQYIWMKISAIGWCTFSSFILHLVLLFTEHKAGKNNILKVLLYFPSALFFYISVFLYKKDSLPSIFVQNFFNIGDFTYHFSFLLTSIVLVAAWGRRSKNIRYRKQANIIVAASLLPFMLNLFTQSILPAFGIAALPLMGHIYSLIMVIGVYYAMIRYGFFIITPTQLIEEIQQEMMDIVIVVAPDGRIKKVNNSTIKLLGYTKAELLDKPLDLIIKNEEVLKVMDSSMYSEIFRYSNINCIRKDGSGVPVNISCSPIVDSLMRDTLGMVIVGQDITIIRKLEMEVEEHKKAEEYIIYMANHDSLTGLPNRKYFYQLLEKALKSGEMTNERFAVLFLDLDDLKLVNDNFGHEAGDQLLCEVGHRAVSAINQGNIVARIGGDEFTFLLFDVNNIEEARKAADKIVEYVNKPINIYERSINVSSSIGVSIFPDDGIDMESLIKKADDDMYAVKKKKKNLVW